MMKWSAAVLLLMAAGCASTQEDSAVSPRGPVENVITISSGDGTVQGEMRVTREDYVARNTVEATPDEVLAVLPAAFVGVGLPAPEIDEQRRLAVVPPHVVSRRLGGVRMSTLLDCGRGMAGPYADTYRIHLSVSTEIRPLGEDASTVLTRVEATGQNTGGTAGNVRCSSLGQLEGRIVDALREGVR